VKRIVVAALFATAALVALTTSAFAQSGGNVVSADGQPVTGADGQPVEWTGKGTSSAGSP
jgi:hypothetical protein